MRRLQRVSFALHLILICAFLPALAWAARWNPDDEHPCTVKRQMTFRQMMKYFGPTGLPKLFPEPVVIRNDVFERNQHFRQMCQRQDLLEHLGPTFPITLSSSNSYSENRRTIPLQQYLDEIRDEHEITPETLANETWYLFGETYSPEWTAFLNHYDVPPCQTCEDLPVALAFGIGNRGSGAQWHIHGPGFSEAVQGRKHWLLYPPNQKPDFHKDQSSRNWMETNYFKARRKPIECTLHPGDYIYFPDGWWHAIVNLDPFTAFISAFTTEPIHDEF